MRIYILIILALFTFSAASAQYNWALKSNRDGIKVYSSLVPDSKFKAIKVECDMKATPAQLVRVLMDVKACPEWVYHTKSCTMLKQLSPNEVYYYSEVSIPWPAENRDFVAHLTVHQNPETKVVTVDGPAVAGMVPVKEGVTRIYESKGQWIITPINKDNVKVVYTLQVDPGGNFPAWLINLLAAEGPVKSFQALREQIKKPAYQQVTASLNN